ncbi:MAG: hypothetical protein CMM37_06720 [Rhodospirillaceae bacterium]|nr:hypothetical protein [Rhodospirillaceae bacterium]
MSDKLKFSRRNFILSSLATGGLYGCKPAHISHPQIISNAYNGKRLIILELDGGNDGLNTIVPFTDDNYFRNRPTLALRKRDIIKLNANTGIHDSLSKLADLYFNGEVAVIQGLGYPSPNLSHFKSTALWHVGGDGRRTRHEGWIAQAAQDFMSDAAAHGISFSEEMGPFFHRGGIFISARNVEQLKNIELAKVNATTFQSTAVSLVAKRAKSLTYSLKALRKHLRGVRQQPDMPDGALGEQLAEIVKVIQSGAPVPVFSAKLSGFDTHSNQYYRHRRLMRELSNAIMSTRNELLDSGHWRSTIILTTSEFGRRMMENKSRGTDHGTAAPHFIIGGDVKGGLYSDAPDLQNLGRNEDIGSTMDYRAVYNAIIENYFGVNSKFRPYRDSRLEGLFKI